MKWLVFLLAAGVWVGAGSRMEATAAQSPVKAVKPGKTAVQVWAASPFARCVRLRESHDGADPNAANNLYGVQARNAGYGGGTSYSWARGVPRRVQDGIAYRLFLRYGDSAWRPYDGCVWTGV